MSTPHCIPDGPLWGLISPDPLSGDTVATAVASADRGRSVETYLRYEFDVLDYLSFDLRATFITKSTHSQADRHS